MKVFLEVFLIRLIFEFIREPIISFILLINVLAQFLDTDLEFCAAYIIIAATFFICRISLMSWLRCFHLFSILVAQLQLTLKVRLRGCAWW
jgi:hypothetical protein